MELKSSSLYLLRLLANAATFEIRCTQTNRTTTLTLSHMHAEGSVIAIEDLILYLEHSFHIKREDLTLFC